MGKCIRPFFVLVLLFIFIPTLLAKAAVPIPTPKIETFLPDNIGQKEKITLTGLTARNTEVLVYFDGSFAGLTEVSSEGTLTDNFYFKTPIKLTVGTHKVAVVAKDRTSLVLSPISEDIFFEVKKISAPTLVAPNEKTVTAKVKPIITGLTKSDTFVHIFIDGKLNGKTSLLRHESGTANFAYTPFLNLSVGTHTITAITEDLNGNQSGPSREMKFRIEEPLPVPILMNPIGARSSNPTMAGLAVNNTKIRIFVDHKLTKEFKVANNESGTANFAYTIETPLAGGAHLLYATAIDSRGKESRWSNLQYINTGAAPLISEEAVSEEKKDIEVKSSELTPTDTDNGKSEESGSSEDKQSGIDQVEIDGSTDKAIDKDVEEIINKAVEEPDAQTGSIDESKKQQGRLQLNLVIFILFLIAVIVWIFWVNRELIKERREQNEKDE